uniref:peptide-methionine (S)-S-oxide reductase n=1 Tax=Leptocylindrus danicus TaxID=163516 RepID=A0A7S2JZ75_9STRA|mmetsp:Transcript_14741/g.21763  ORF Transcript_14741/g.21763 Transcript_14741/m.21763 type:complete len:121 (+) Transcript_14741:273-635(+)|eukprot:CAMPEP_0116026232 /NCGR_PEP_ID=MMETSP0321-20121206/13683_1 /TAXON_ID=163516 /ORGANISM="Leptocylindrus danicus var. danicus, Strain B650" /LENGTH=120 /DNA_ID=CAMNT_0003498901 /DNA_START=212 /DNA_END=574 /DNA_ORIENTATION=-
MKGVARCVVGYAGGMQLNPTYRSIKDATECVLVEYDPDQTSFEDMLIEFTRQHGPFYPAFKRQYRSVAFFKTEEEKQIIDQVLSAYGHAAKKKIHTDVEPITPFYRAEEYHQDYIEKRNR